MEYRTRADVPARFIGLGGDQIGLDSVDAVDAVDEEDEYEDEGDLHPILNFGHDRIIGDEAARQAASARELFAAVWEVSEGGEEHAREELASEGEGQRHDQEHEEHHLCHQQDEDLLHAGVSSRLVRYRERKRATTADRRTRV
jgi:hypothetical protein